jgi:exodeoxyribonuclease V gamma subunit
MLKKEYTLHEWADVINKILDLLFTGDKTSSQLNPLYGLSLKLNDIQNESLFEKKVNVRVIYELFDRSMSAQSFGGDFASGNLIFCEMLPMRSIPKKVICIIGMNDSAFPRKSSSVSFDLISTHPKTGDRSVRDEDRFLFLETLISARENLYISYMGKNITNGTERNPSVVVNELLEYIEGRYKSDAGKSIRDYIFKTHRIQSYNPVYFISDSGFFTYQGSKIGGAKSYAKSEKTNFRFMNELLPELSDDEKNITVNELASFLSNPSKWVMNKRLGLNLTPRYYEYIEEEQFKLEALDLYRLNSDIMQALINGDDPDDHFRFAKAAGLLPHGNIGVVAYKNAFAQVKKFYDRFSHLLHDKSPGIELSLNVDDITITGRADNIYDGRLIFFRNASERSTDILIPWITHLLLLGSDKFSGDTISLSKDSAREWGRINDSKEILSDLLNIYREGVRKPIPLFPKSSLKYIDEFYADKQGEPGARALKKAEESFYGGYTAGDSLDPYIKLFFGDSYTLRKPFIELALRVYSHIFENIKREE